MKKKMLVVLMAVSTVLLFSGCGAVSKDSSYTDNNYTGNSYTYDVMPEMEYMEEAMEYDSAAMGSDMGGVGQGSVLDNAAAATNRKLIRTVDMNVETKEFDQLLEAVETQVKLLDGYIENLNLHNGHSYYNNRRGTRNAEMVIRIPSNQMDSFLSTVSDIGNVISRSEAEKDITLTYVDLDSHKKALIAQQDRLIELMQKAESIEDLIAVESRLSDLRYQIQSMESQLRTFDNQVDYGTINLYINEVEVLTPVEEETAWERISTGFTENLKAIKDGMLDFVIWFLISIPFLLIWAIVITAIIIVIRLLIKRRKKKHALQVETIQLQTEKEKDK